MNRRNFIQASSAATTLLCLAGASPKAPRRVGLIGAGWYGKVDLIHLLQIASVEVVSVCDVDSKMLTQAADLFESRNKSGKRPQTFSDFRKQLQTVEHDLIIVGTPDHWHALPAIEAMESGAHVYCEKPTACDVLESKAMLDTARRLNKKLQIGTQRRRIPHLLKAKKEIVDAGLLGDIGLVEMCCYFHMRRRNTLVDSPDTNPPKHLDWNRWCGPAPKMPYNDIMHPKGWRSYMEYGNGIVGDMCVHIFDMTRWMLGLGWPKTIGSTGGILVETESRANITDTQNVTFGYDNLDMTWTHRTWGSPPDPEYQWATVLYGSKGTLKLDFTKFQFIPRGKGSRIEGSSQAETDKYPQDLADNKQWNVDLIGALGSRDLMQDWLLAIDQDRRPIADIEEGHISSASCILANHAMKLGRSLHWDPNKHEIKNDPAANQQLKRDYRSPWQHPAG